MSDQRHRVCVSALGRSSSKRCLQRMCLCERSASPQLSWRLQFAEEVRVRVICDAQECQVRECPQKCQVGVSHKSVK